MVAHFQIGDAGAHFHHLAGGFVAQRHGQRPGPVAVDHRQVGVAQAGGAHPHQNLAVARGVQFHLFDFQRLGVLERALGAHLTQYCGTGFHCVSSSLSLVKVWSFSPLKKRRP